MHTGKDPWDGMNMQQIIRAVSVYYRAPAVPETTHAHALLERCFQRNAVDRLSAGDLADAFAPPLGTSGARAVISELFEENDRLKVDNERLESELISCQALLLRTEEKKNLIEDGLARLGFSAALYLKPILAEFMGKDLCARTEVVKAIWGHAKEKNLHVCVCQHPCQHPCQHLCQHQKIYGATLRRRS
jgi:hypothetical protein